MTKKTTNKYIPKEAMDAWHMQTLQVGFHSRFEPTIVHGFKPVRTETFHFIFGSTCELPAHYRFLRLGLPPLDDDFTGRRR